MQGGNVALPALFYAVGRLGKIVAFLVVQFLYALQVLGQCLLVQHRALAGLHGCLNILGIDLVGAGDDDVFNAGLFNNVKNKDAAFHVGVDILEVAHFPQALDFLVDGCRIGPVAPVDAHAHEHDIGLDIAEAADLDI